MARVSGARGDENLHLRVGADHRADVATVEHGAFRPRREAALHVDERRAHRRHGRDDGRRLAHVAGAQPLFVEVGERQAARGGDRRFDVVEPQPLLQQRAGRGAVEQARVEMRQAVMRRKTSRQRALPRRRGAVDRDDEAHEKRAPSRSMSGRNAGKLVAIIVSSSTVTLFSAASPMTRKLMAMR